MRHQRTTYTSNLNVLFNVKVAIGLRWYVGLNGTLYPICGVQGCILRIFQKPISVALSVRWCGCSLGVSIQLVFVLRREEELWPCAGESEWMFVPTSE